jgi:long-chain acyl-CoA synthetase
VGLMLPNCPQFIVAYNASHLLGAVVVAVNPLMPVLEVERELEETGCKVFIVLDRLLEKLPERHPDTVLVADAAYYAPVHLRMLSRLRQSIDLPLGALRFEDLLHGEVLDDFEKIDPVQDVAVVLYTSGTTGDPKGVMLTHYNLVSNALQSYHWLRGWGYSAKPQSLGWPVILCALPFFHSYGLVTLNEAVSFGCSMVLIPNPTPLNIMEAVERHHVTHFPLIPRLIREIVMHPQLDKFDLTSLTTCASGGASIPPEDMKAFEAVSGARMYQGYGLTEAGPSVCATPIEGDPNYLSVGLPYPDTEVRIMDLQVGEVETPSGADGEIVVKGPQIMKGYWGHPVESIEAIRRGWLYTGDVGHIDDKGYLYVVGRRDDKIIAGGHNVWPVMVEECLASSPLVEQAVAFGAPDPLRCSTEIVATVKLRYGVEQYNGLEYELIELCRSKLEEYQVPSRIIVMDSVPLTVMGKVDRKKVLTELEERMKQLIQGAGSVETGKGL